MSKAGVFRTEGTAEYFAEREGKIQVRRKHYYEQRYNPIAEYSARKQEGV